MPTSANRRLPYNLLTNDKACYNQLEVLTAWCVVASFVTTPAEDHETHWINETTNHPPHHASLSRDGHQVTTPSLHDYPLLRMVTPHKIPQYHHTKAVLVTAVICLTSTLAYQGWCSCTDYTALLGLLPTRHTGWSVGYNTLSFL